MKILHLISSAEIGGAQQIRLGLIQQLISLASEDDLEQVVVFFNDGPMRKKFATLGIKTYCVPLSWKTFGWETWKALCEIVERTQPDLIHSQLWMANFFARLLARRYHVPVICDQHNRSSLNGTFKNLLDKFFKLPATKFVAVSKAVADDFLVNLGVDCVVINNGVDANQFKFSFDARTKLRSELDIEQNCFVVGGVGRFETVKHFDHLLHAFARMQKTMPLRRSYLVLVGSGPLKKSLQNLAGRLKIVDSVRFCSTEQCMYRYYSMFDCWVSTSFSEGLSVAMLEALFSGLPAICTIVPDEIASVCTGCVRVPFGNTERIASALVACARKFNPNFTMRPALLDKQFDISTMALRYYGLYLDVICAKGERQ